MHTTELDGGGVIIYNPDLSGEIILRFRDGRRVNVNPATVDALRKACVMARDELREWQEQIAPLCPRDKEPRTAQVLRSIDAALALAGKVKP